MRDRIALPLIVLAAAAMIALAMVWPQGQGRRSPAPFGRPMAAMEKPVTVSGHKIAPVKDAPDVAEEALHDAQ
jgi:hypothetical protein